MWFAKLRYLWNKKRIKKIKKSHSHLETRINTIRQEKKIQKEKALIPFCKKMYSQFKATYSKDNDNIITMTKSLKKALDKATNDKLSKKQIIELFLLTSCVVDNLNIKDDLSSFLNISIQDVVDEFPLLSRLETSTRITQRQLLKILELLLMHTHDVIKNTNIKLLSKHVVTSQFGTDIGDPYNIEPIKTVIVNCPSNNDSNKNNRLVKKLKIKAIKNHGDGVFNIHFTTLDSDEAYACSFGHVPTVLMGDIVKLKNHSLASDNPKNSLKSVKLLKALENKNHEFAFSSEH